MSILNLFLQQCVNLTIILYNSVISVKDFFINLPYLNLTIIILTGYFVYRLLSYEAEEIKNPHTKAGRRRI